eukprot:Nk52_evm27s2496 gene=Nk52_evmTU27s2496
MPGSLVMQRTSGGFEFYCTGNQKLGKPGFRVEGADNSSSAIRSRFLRYFEAIGHLRVPSSTIVPKNDASLLFTNAGMVQFKECFVGAHPPPAVNVVTAQKCMRAGGKHNDLENVGKTPRHHTFFEMLGNFSFGGYFKEQASRQSWEFLTKELSLPKERLLITVLEDDMEAYEVWRKIAPETKIMKMGKEDNFWSMGEYGPQGSCTEIYWDLQNGLDFDDRYLELWNIVFMEDEKLKDGTIRKLKTPCIDTGMGLERIASVLQEKNTNYDIDSFHSLKGHIKRICESPDLSGYFLNVVADHARACSFLVSEGVLPSNIGAGYVLRRLIRRIVGLGRNCVGKPFFGEVCKQFLEDVGDIEMSIAYQHADIVSVIKQEESLFWENMDKSMGALLRAIEKCKARSEKLSAEDVKLFYESYGIPFEVIWIVCHDSGVNADISQAEDMLDLDKERNRESGVVKDVNSNFVSGFESWKRQGLMSSFCGYSSVKVNAKIVGVEKATCSQGTYVCLDQCPFYVEGGGQVGDVGSLFVNGARIEVKDCIRPYKGCVALLTELPDGTGECELTVGQEVVAIVDEERRKRTSAHHSATHVLHASLKRVLGESVVQAGSRVDPDQLRLDVSYHKPITEAEIGKVEAYVNEAALRDIEVKSLLMPLEEAVESGAVAMFGEKYGNEVRVVDMPGCAKELCGGTHVERLLDIYPFKIVQEGGVASGTRRIEAVTGAKAVEYLMARDSIAREIGSILGCKFEDAVSKLQKLMESNKVNFKKLKNSRAKLASHPGLALKTLKVKKEGDQNSSSVQMHVLDRDEESDVIRLYGTLRADAEPEVAHVVIAGNAISVFTCKKSKKLSSGDLVKEILGASEALGLKGKGGGSKTMGRCFFQGKEDDELGEKAFLEWAKKRN